jgi:hypothetical protein
MANQKIDGYIDAVRYTPAGKIAQVRVSERRGAVWSDHVLLERQELSARIKQGKRFASGERMILSGSVFKTGKMVCQVNDLILTGDHAGTRDLLDGVPLF